MARFRLIPREEKFFADFSAIAAELHNGAQLLEQMLASEPPDHARADDIKELEHRCDSMTHDVYQRLHRTFVTPIDREDIHAIARSLDDVMDMIDASAGFVRIYRVPTVRFGARELARVIVRSTEQLKIGMPRLDSKKGIDEHVVEINRLENEADRIHQQAIQRLFEDETDPAAIIKWKEILDTLEETTDRCEDVANVLEGIVLKHA